jgi:anaerobic magnesium-protoporphyrin IX monomethyl ester cyclase
MDKPTPRTRRQAQIGQHSGSRRVLFIYPNINTQVGFNYGIAYISGYLEAHGIETSLLNVNEKLGYPLDLERIRRDVLGIRPDLIGFSVLTNQQKYALQIASSIKTYYDAPILFGGIHTTMDPAGVLSEGAVDYICMGEGEEATLELIEKGRPEGVQNIGYRSEGRLVIEPLRPFVDITKLPFKNYEIFDFQRLIDAKDGWVGLTASRGCPFRCTYCLNHKIMSLYHEHGHPPKTYLRRHSVAEVIDEIEYLLSHYNRIKMFIFDDDIFTFDKQWLKEFSERYRSLTDMPFVCNAHARVFDEEMAADLKRAGCRIVKFGLESGSDSIRRVVLNRYMTNNDIEKAFATADKFGLHTSAFVMIGLPHETPEDLRETVELLARIRPGRFRWSLFFPFVGTKAYDRAAEGSFIDFEKMKSLDNFTDETCMRLGPDIDLTVDKLKSLFCLYVNGRDRFGGLERYGEILKQVEEAGPETWSIKKANFIEQVKAIDKEMQKEGKSYYTIKYNSFMGVRSDWTDDSISA